MLVKVTGFTPVAVFFTVTAVVAVVFTTILLNVTLDGVKLSVGACALACGRINSAPASSATRQMQNLTDVCAGRNLWAMTRGFMKVSTDAKLETAHSVVNKDPGFQTAATRGGVEARLSH